MSILYKQLFLCVVWIWGGGSAFSNELSSYETSLLTPFFKALLEKTETGYVVYDKKPICALEFREGSCYFQSEFHSVSVAIWGVKEILNGPMFSNGNIVFHLDQTNGWFLVINKPLFIKTVQENLVLFQYALGPTVTPIVLLNELLFSGQSFCSVFNHDRTLIGIVLGYGVQNSLFHSRLEQIQCDEMDSPDIPPFASKVNLCSDDLTREMFLFFSADESESWSKEKKAKPSLGFCSLKQEVETLSKKIVAPSGQLVLQRPYFIFGYLDDKKENERLIQELELTQGNIHKLLQSPTFLEDLFEIVMGKKPKIKGGGKITFPLLSLDLNLAAAKLLMEDLQDCEKGDHIYFIEGLIGQKNIEPRKQRSGFPGTVKNIKSAKFNLEKSDLFFEKLESDESFVSVLDHYLYYKILEEGDGHSKQNETKVCLDFDIFDPSGKNLISTSIKQLDLENAIPGFAHGMKGMKIGEKREIYIHPSLAYGVHTFLEKGIYLKATVRLVNLIASDGVLPPLIPQDLSFIRDENYQKELEENHRKFLCSLGMNRGHFLKLCPGIDIRKVAHFLKTLPEEKTPSQEELEALNQVFWLHYFGTN